MTPEEVFAQLRDIHLPERVTTLATSFDFRPILAFAALLALVLFVRRIRAKSQVHVLLARADAAAGPAAQRDALAALLAASPKPGSAEPPPQSLFDPPEDLTAEAVADLRQWVGNRIR